MDPQNARWLMVAAIGDVVIGVVLAIVGQAKDVSELSIIGGLLLLAGFVMMAWILTTRGRTPSP